MTRARTVIYVVSVSPPLDGHIADTKALRQYRAQDKERRGEAWISARIFGVVVSCLCRLMPISVLLDEPDEEGFCQQSKDNIYLSIEHLKTYI